MPEFKYSCPACKQVLKTANPLPGGKKIKCPRCAQLFAPAAPPTTPAAPPVEDDPEPAAKPAKPKKRRRNKLVLFCIVFLFAFGVPGLIFALIDRGYLPWERVLSGLGRSAPPTSPSATSPAPAPFDVAHIAADFNAAIIVHPGRIARSSLLAPLPLEELLAPVIKETGVDPRTIEQVVLLVDPLPGGDVPFLPGGIVRFAEKVDGKQFPDRAFPDGEPVTYQDKTYHRSKSVDLAKALWAGHVADERTVLVAPEPVLHKMLTAENVKSELVERLRNADMNHDFVAVFVLEPEKIRPVLGAMLKAMLPDEADTATLPDRLQAGSLAIDFGGKTLLTVTLEGRDEEAARFVEELVNKGHARARKEFVAGRKDLTALLPADIAEPALAVAEQAMGGFSIKKDGTRVTATVAMPPGLSDLTKKLTPLLKPATEAPPAKAKP